MYFTVITVNNITGNSAESIVEYELPFVYSKKQLMVGVWSTNQHFVTGARYAQVTTTTSHLLYLCLIGTATLGKSDQYTELNQILLLSTEMSACTWNKNIISISNALYIHKHNFLKLKFMYDLQTHFFYVGLIPYSSKFVKLLGCWCISAVANLLKRQHIKNECSLHAWKLIGMCTSHMECWHRKEHNCLLHRAHTVTGVTAKLGSGQKPTET
jgi:hypothetical protein